MVFSSLIFVFAFLPLLFILYFICPNKLKNYLLLLFSLIFYLFGGAKALLLMIVIVFIDYIMALLIDKYKSKGLLIFTVVINIGVLFYYKYYNFFIDNINYLFNSSISVKNIILPIGISFWTFQVLSYVIDVYRKKVDVQKNFFYLLLYVSFFPQLVAGPIVRYKDIENEIKNRSVSLDDFTYGLERFILGLAKKMIIANHMGKLADIVYSLDVLSTPVAWLGVIAYMFQIYFDFSAYSDMAIGLGRMFGFHFLENFDYPYISLSITEFWRRWHISLSSFFKDYVYIPLGGNRRGVYRQILNLFIVWLLTGFWHGASWNFVLWGLYYLVFLILEKFVLKKVFDKVPKFMRHIYTLTIVLIGWVLFRAENLTIFMNMIKHLFTLEFTSYSLNETIVYLETYYVYFILAILFSMPIYPKLVEKIKVIKNIKCRYLCEILHYGFLLVVFIITIMFLAQSNYNPFIYFRF